MSILILLHIQFLFVFDQFQNLPDYQHFFVVKKIYLVIFYVSKKVNNKNNWDI